MKKAFRILICCVVSFIIVYLSGYSNLMNDISESLAVTAFIGAALVLSILLILIWEMHVKFKGEINQLTKRIKALEEKDNPK